MQKNLLERLQARRAKPHPPAFRKLGAFLGINHATLYRYLHGDPVINRKHRIALGLPVITRHRVTTDLDPATIARLDAAAQDAGVSRAAWLRRLIEEELA